LYHPEKTQIFFLPTLNWNKYNTTSVGMSFYNRFIPKGGISYKLSPMYSFGTKRVVGSGNFSLNHYSNKLAFTHTKISFDAKKFNYTSDFSYERFSPSLEFTIKQTLRSKKESKITASLIHLDKEGYEGQNSELPVLPNPEILQFLNIGYSFSNNKIINPYNINLDLESSDDFTKADIQINYTYNLNKKKKIKARFYIGKVITTNDNYNLQMSAWNGTNDYSFSENSFARSEEDGNLSKQIFIKEGGLKHTTKFTSDNWISSVSLDYNFMKNINIYVEGGINGRINKIDYAFGSGLQYQISGLSIYLPLYTENGLLNGESFSESIRIGIQSKINFNTFGF